MYVRSTQQHPLRPSTHCSPPPRLRHRVQIAPCQARHQPRRHAFSMSSTAETSHGRGGAGNMAADDTEHVDGEVLRPGQAGDGAFSAGRGGEPRASLSTFRRPFGRRDGRVEADALLPQAPATSSTPTRRPRGVRTGTWRPPSARAPVTRTFTRDGAASATSTRGRAASATTSRQRTATGRRGARTGAWRTGSSTSCSAS